MKFPKHNRKIILGLGIVFLLFIFAFGFILTQTDLFNNHHYPPGLKPTNIPVTYHIGDLIGSTGYVLSSFEGTGLNPTATPQSSQKILCLGDSITYGYAADGAITSYPSTLQSLSGISVTNGGVGGDTTSGMLSRWNSNYQSHGYTILVVLGGINDVFQGTSASTIEGNLQSIWQSALNSGCSVYALTILPNWGSAEVISVNSWIKANAPALGVHVVDTYSLFNDPNNSGYLKPSYDSGDGTHPNQAGANLIATTVNSALSAPTPTSTASPVFAIFTTTSNGNTVMYQLKSNQAIVLNGYNYDVTSYSISQQTITLIQNTGV